MTHNDLPIRWKERVERWLQARGRVNWLVLSANDFGPKVVHLQLGDGSSASFRFAFVIEAPEINEIGVFTEHCGYHIFPFVDTTIRIDDDDGTMEPPL
jgi:hypothetical protein